MPSQFVYLVALVLLALQTGCATVTKSANQSVTVDTRPPGAECTLEREGETLAVINPTPGAISVEKDKDVIQVTCKKAGFQNSSGELDSTFESMTLGNILLGGVIGIGIDAASGAMHKYPSTVTITLRPMRFSSLQERDAFFDRQRDDFLEEYSQLEKKIVAQCQDEDCEEKLNTAKEAKQTKLAKIEMERLSAAYGCENGDCPPTEQPVAQAAVASGATAATPALPPTVRRAVLQDQLDLTGIDADLVFVEDIPLNYLGKATFRRGRSLEVRDWSCTVVARDEKLEVLPRGTILKVRGEEHYVDRAGAWYNVSIFSAGGTIDKIECRVNSAGRGQSQLEREHLHEVFGKVAVIPGSATID